MTIVFASDGIGCDFGCDNREEIAGLLDTKYLLYDISPAFL